MVHHQVAPVGVAVLDRMMLMNAEDLSQGLREVQNVCAVFCGHVHVASEEVRDGIPVFTTPSTCFQFSEGPTGLTVSLASPMLRLVTCQGREISSIVVPV